MNGPRPTLAKTEVAPPGTVLGPIQEGTEIAGRYRVLSLVGEGGMGAVYRAQHLHLRKVFALKVLHPRNSARHDFAARFEREAIAAARIEHANVVPATDFGRLPDGSFFLVLEFVNGRSLRSELKAGAMRVPRAIGIMRGVVAGVRAAHEKGIVHRDLKPENIMLVERDGNRDFVKLLDFGVATLDAARDGEPRLTEAGAMLGTPQYMSPEQILGRPVDARTDLYSLGVIFFELLSGRCPFAGNLATLLEQHVTLPAPELPPTVAAKEPRLAEILRALLAKDPQERFPTAKDLAVALDEVSRPTGRTPVDCRAPTSLAQLVSSVSAVASSGVLRVRDYLARVRRDRASRTRGRQLMKTARRLLASARAASASGIGWCRARWRLGTRAWRLAVGGLLTLGFIVLLVCTVRGCQGADQPEESSRPDRSGAKRPAAKAGGSKSQHEGRSPTPVR